MTGLPIGHLPTRKKFAAAGRFISKHLRSRVLLLVFAPSFLRKRKEKEEKLIINTTFFAVTSLLDPDEWELGQRALFNRKKFASEAVLRSPLRTNMRQVMVILQGGQGK